MLSMLVVVVKQVFMLNLEPFVEKALKTCLPKKRKSLLGKIIRKLSDDAGIK